MTIRIFEPTRIFLSLTTSPEDEYLIDLDTLECGCPAALDFATRSPGYPCKHILAVIATQAKKTPARRRQGSPFALLNCKRTEL